MFQTILSGIHTFFQAIPFSSQTWFVLMIIAVIWYLFAKANKDPKSPIRWEDLIIDVTADKSERVSPYKLGYLIGIVVGTWIVLSFADGGKLTYDIFGMYLTFLLGGAGWSAFMRNKQQSNAYGNDSYDNTYNRDPRRINGTQSDDPMGDTPDVDASGHIR